MTAGASISIKGNVTAAENLTIAGRVEGEITLTAGVLFLAAGSQVVGDVVGPSVVVHGAVQGHIKADAVDIRAGASVAGTLATVRLAIEDGAQMNGDVEMPEKSRPRLVASAGPFDLPVAV
jgi:cytoskeletal protein CcmA (bactofilin family)